MRVQGADARLLGICSDLSLLFFVDSAIRSSQHPTPPIPFLQKLNRASMSAGEVVFISGATGLWSSGINGPYDRTAEVSGGYPVYMKRGDGSMCIEHQDGQWKVRHVASKGSSICYARVTGNCALEDCASRTWSVRQKFESWVDQPLKIVVGADAEREVTHPPLHSIRPPPPFNLHAI